MNTVSNAATSKRHPSGRYPLLCASFSFSAGIIFGHYAWRPPLWWVVAWLVFAFSAAYVLRRRTTAAIWPSFGVPQLLEAVHPHFAVISVDARNSYGHPRQEVLGRLAQAHVATYRTDLNGAVSFYLDRSQVTARPLDLQ